MNKYPLIAGRLLIGLYFLLPGLMKFIDWDFHITLMDKHGMVMIPFLLAAAGTIQIGSSLLIIANRWVVPSSLILAGMVVLINFNLHDFWNYSGIEGAHEMQNFIKNLAILGGLLILAGSSFKPRINDNNL